MLSKSASRLSHGYALLNQPINMIENEDGDADSDTDLQKGSLAVTTYQQ